MAVKKGKRRKMITVGDEQWEIWEERAKKRGMTTSKYICCQMYVSCKDYEEDKNIQEQIMIAKTKWLDI